MEETKVTYADYENSSVVSASLERLAYAQFYLGKVKEELGDETAAQHFKFAKDNGLELK